MFYLTGGRGRKHIFIYASDKDAGGELHNHVVPSPLNKDGKLL